MRLGPKEIEEIRTSYRWAANRKAQVGILADLYGVTKEDILELIRPQDQKPLSLSRPTEKKQAKITAEDKRAAVLRIARGKASRYSTAMRFAVGKATVQNWIRAAIDEGLVTPEQVVPRPVEKTTNKIFFESTECRPGAKWAEGLEDVDRMGRKKTYTREFKKKVSAAVLGGMSQAQAAKEFDVPLPNVGRWVALARKDAAADAFVKTVTGEQPAAMLPLEGMTEQEYQETFRPAVTPDPAANPEAEKTEEKPAEAEPKEEFEAEPDREDESISSWGKRWAKEYLKVTEEKEKDKTQGPVLVTRGPDEVAMHSCKVVAKDDFLTDGLRWEAEMQVENRLEELEEKIDQLDELKKTLSEFARQLSDFKIYTDEDEVMLVSMGDRLKAMGEGLSMAYQIMSN